MLHKVCWSLSFYDLELSDSDRHSLLLYYICANPTQHVKWLKELQEKKKALEEQKKADEDERLERRRIFMEREAKKRAAAKACSPQSDTHNMLDKVHILHTADDDASTAASTIASTVSDTDNNNRRKKPAWCQSEADREAVEADDEVNLLSFVDGLDFDQYTQDLEIQTLMGQVKDRIKLLEREHKKDETKLQTCLDVRVHILCRLYFL